MKKKYSTLLSALMIIALIALLGNDMLQKVYAADTSGFLNDITGEVSIDNVAKTQEQLNALLEDETVSQIVIDVEEGGQIKIPKGDYSDKTLVVNASNLGIQNSGFFKLIKIEASNDLDWVEYSENNSFDILSSNITMEIEAQSKVNSIAFGGLTEKSEAKTVVEKDTLDLKEEIINNAKLVIYGNLASLVTDVTSKLNISGDGNLDQITISSDAKDSELATSMTTKITSYTDSTIALIQGAEESRVEFLSKVNARVENLTDSNIMVYWLQDYWFNNDWFHACCPIGKMTGFLITPLESSLIKNLEVSSITKLSPKATTSVTTFEMTAGLPLRAFGLYGVFQYGSTILPGTLEWLNPNMEVITSGYYPWVFIPTDSEHYNNVYGISYVNVSQFVIPKPE